MLGIHLRTGNTDVSEQNREFVFWKKTPNLYKNRCLDRQPARRKHPNRYEGRCQDSIQGEGEDLGGTLLVPVLRARTFYMGEGGSCEDGKVPVNGTRKSIRVVNDMHRVIK